MSYKVIRDASGEAIAFGPNTEQYQPVVPLGATLADAVQATTTVAQIEEVVW